MTDKFQEQENDQVQNQESPYEEYGWEFHKIPLLSAAIVTFLLYAFIFFYVKYS